MAPNRAKRLFAELTRRFEAASKAPPPAKAAPKAEPKAPPAKAAAPGLEALQDFTDLEQAIIEHFGSLSPEQREAFLAQYDGELPQVVKFRLGVLANGRRRVINIPRRRALELLRKLRE